MTEFYRADVNKPQRIQLRRTKGWRKPEGAIVVSRPTKLGNPFRAYKCGCCGRWDVVDDNGVSYLVNHEYCRRPEVRADRTTWTTKDDATHTAVRLYNYWVGGRMSYDPEFAAAVHSLAGHDLACWCPLEDAAGRRVPCHADVLLVLANGGDPA